MTNPTLERAARAVSDAFPLTNGPDAYAQPPQFKLGYKTCLDIARAVLMAVREPDDNVCRVIPGYDCKAVGHADFGRWVGYADDSDSFMPGGAFTAMIDAILREKNDAS